MGSVARTPQFAGAEHESGATLWQQRCWPLGRAAVPYYAKYLYYKGWEELIVGAFAFSQLAAMPVMFGELCNPVHGPQRKLKDLSGSAYLHIADPMPIDLLRHAQSRIPR